MTKKFIKTQTMKLNLKKIYNIKTNSKIQNILKMKHNRFIKKYQNTMITNILKKMILKLVVKWKNRISSK